MATIGIMVSGSAVPTAASTLPTAPWPSFSLPPRISTAFVNSDAATRMTASANRELQGYGQVPSLCKVLGKERTTEM